MPFPRKSDNTLDFTRFEMYNEIEQDTFLDELEATGSPADHKQAHDYFEKQGNEGRELKAQLDLQKKQITSRIAVLEEREAIIFSKTSVKIANNLQKNTRKGKGCSIS